MNKPIQWKNIANDTQHALAHQQELRFISEGKVSLLEARIKIIKEGSEIDQQLLACKDQRIEMMQQMIESLRNQVKLLKQ